jgi:hypothetical protein
MPAFLRETPEGYPAVDQQHFAALYRFHQADIHLCPGTFYFYQGCKLLKVNLKHFRR